MTSIKLVILLLKGIWYAFRTMFWLGLWLFGIGVLLTFPLRWWSGDRFLLVRLTSYLMPWLLIGLVPGLIVTAIARRLRLLLTLAAPAVLIGLTYAPLFLPRANVALANSPSFKVMSYNVLSENKKMGTVAGVIQQERPDILLLQEVHPGQMQALARKLDGLYRDANLHVAYEPEIQQAILSRYPLIPLEVTPQRARAQKVLIDTPKGLITVWNVHPSSRIGWRRRYQQISALVAKEIGLENGPVILGGDFNVTDQTQAYRLISEQLMDAHWEAGWGFGFTFPNTAPYEGIGSLLPLLVRIDHIFHSDHFIATSATTLPEAGSSDHLPVVAELLWVK